MRDRVSAANFEQCMRGMRQQSRDRSDSDPDFDFVLWWTDQQPLSGGTRFFGRACLGLEEMAEARVSGAGDSIGERLHAIRHRLEADGAELLRSSCRCSWISSWVRADSIAAAPFAVGSRLRIFHGGKVYPIALWEPALLQEIERLLDMRLGEGGTTCTDKQDRVHGQTGGDDVLEGVLHVWQWGRLIEPVEQFLAAALQAEVDAAQAPGAHLLELLNAVAQAGKAVDEGMKPQEPRCAAAGPVGAHHLVRLGEFKTEAKDFEEWGEELEWNPEGVGLAQEDGGFRLRSSPWKATASLRCWANVSGF